jgi:hypothetical protein
MQLERLEALAITDDHQAQEQAWERARHDWERKRPQLQLVLRQKRVLEDQLLCDGG